MPIMNDIEISIRLVKDAEVYLVAARNYLEQLQNQIRNCSDSVEKKKLENTLEQARMRFAQLCKDVVIYKASRGIFTDPIDPSKISKRLE